MIDLFLVREAVDRKRFISIGADENKVIVTGNIKYDQILPGRSAKDIYYSEIKKELKLTNNKIFVAGSIRENEEMKVIDAFCRARKELLPQKLK